MKMICKGIVLVLIVLAAGGCSGDKVQVPDTQGAEGRAGDISKEQLVRAEACLPGFTECDGYCYDLTQTYSHCGECGKPCPSQQLACVNGKCTNYCGKVQVDAKKDLVKFLRGEGWEAIEGQAKYLHVTGTQVVEAADIGDGYMFRPLADGPGGVTLEDEIEFGVTETENGGSVCCDHIKEIGFPQKAFTRAVFQDVNLTVSLEGPYEASDSASCGDDEGQECLEWGYDMWGECMEPYFCCCAAGEINWRPVHIKPVPSGCSGVAFCDGYETGHPSQCHSEYKKYLNAVAGIYHHKCVNDTGHVLEGGSCSCDTGWDNAVDIPGKCRADGRCDMDHGTDDWVPDECS